MIDVFSVVGSFCCFVVSQIFNWLQLIISVISFVLKCQKT